MYNLTGSPRATCSCIFTLNRVSTPSHKYSVECVEWYPLDTGMFTTSGMDRQLKIWDTNRLKPIEIVRFGGRVFHHCVQPFPTAVSSLIAVATYMSKLFLVDLRTGSCIRELRGRSGGMLSCRWAQHSEWVLATGSSHGELLVWDVRTSKNYLKSLDMNNCDRGRVSKAHEGAVNGLCFTYDSMHLVSHGTDGKMRLWNIVSGKNQMINYGKIHNNIKKCVQIDIAVNCNPELVYVPSEGNILTFDVFSGSKVNTLVGHYNTVNCCIYNSLYHELYSGGNDRNILIWTADHSQAEAYEDYQKNKASSPVRNTRSDLYAFQNDEWSSSDDAQDGGEEL